MTLTWESYHEDVHSVDRSHDSGQFFCLNLLQMSVQQSFTMAYSVPCYRQERTLKKCAVGQNWTCTCFWNQLFWAYRKEHAELECKSHTLISGESATHFNRKTQLIGLGLLVCGGKMKPLNSKNLSLSSTLSFSLFLKIIFFKFRLIILHRAAVK